MNHVRLLVQVGKPQQNVAQDGFHQHLRKLELVCHSLHPQIPDRLQRRFENEALKGPLQS